MTGSQNQPGSTGPGKDIALARSPSGIDDPADFHHCKAEINGIRIHYVDEGSGPLVVLLHGFPFLWYLWRHQIRALAAAGYRVIAPDQRGYGQSDCPGDVQAYDMTKLVGDVVGLINASGQGSAVVIGQDWGSPVAYNAALMRPDLVRAVVMICTPPQARGARKPSLALRAALGTKGYYQDYFARAEAEVEITRELRRFLLGIYYSTSGSCREEEQWRWAWNESESFFDTITIPEALPDYLSPEAFDYYLSEFSRTGIRSALNWYRAIDDGWQNTSFLDGAVVRQPSLFMTGARDPALKSIFGIDRQGPAFASLPKNFVALRDILSIPGAGHTPPEEAPQFVNDAILGFLRTI
jgi:pimeloyl-ACP methyl ester carboxylesterase